nr:PREDICTED: homeobox protein SIX5 [Anolis carolinensis]|eukprot:XP_008119750.2 PREDICTED: homeobox protein SIX5 [Anolis carolinensis]
MSSTPEGVSASNTLFLPAAGSGASSILLNGNFITATSPTMFLNGGSVIQTSSGGVILNGLTLGDNQTITLSPVAAAPSPPILLNGSTALLSCKPIVPASQEVSKEPLPPAAVLLKSESQEALGFGVKEEDEEKQSVQPLLSLPDAATLLPDQKEALLGTVSVPQVVPLKEEDPVATQPAAKIVPAAPALPSPLEAVPTLTLATPSPAAVASSDPATVLHVPAPSLVPITQVSPPSQVVPLSQPVSGTQVLSPSQMVPLSPTQIYTLPQGVPAPQIVSLPQVRQGPQIISLPQVVPTSQVVTLQQSVGSPIQILTSSAPIKMGTVAGTQQATVTGGHLGQSGGLHLINTNMGITALQLPGTTPGNILLTNPATGSSTIVTGVALQQGKLILTATFPAGMLMAPILSTPAAVPNLAPPVKQEEAAPPATTLEHHEDGGGSLLLSSIASEVSSLSASDNTGQASFSSFGADSGPSSLLSDFSQNESLSQQQMVWSDPVGMGLQGNGSVGLFEMDKDPMEEQAGLLRLPEDEGLLLDDSGGDPMDPEALDSGEKVLTQLQSVPVEESLDL